MKIDEKQLRKLWSQDTVEHILATQAAGEELLATVKECEMAKAHEKLCLCCAYSEISFGSEGYSEMTPGSPAHIDCNRNHYKRKDQHVDFYDSLIQQAKTCKDFKHR